MLIHRRHSRLALPICFSPICAQKRALSETNGAAGCVCVSNCSEPRGSLQTLCENSFRLAKRTRENRREIHLQPDDHLMRRGTNSFVTDEIIIRTANHFEKRTLTRLSCVGCLECWIPEPILRSSFNGIAVHPTGKRFAGASEMSLGVSIRRIIHSEKSERAARRGGTRDAFQIYPGAVHLRWASAVE